ncbi:YdcF family protein [Frankia sp. AiPs1]|uniref:YdcF family protein n=1 Tax=Frankia sp. AiPs1 TaxID=573493 RepID=UPI002043F317|nr:YdcF family protein [Frankia sp. AiPs1]MCM3921436.1 YdcF family protein [Frankia sp. AiPs1]
MAAGPLERAPAAASRRRAITIALIGALAVAFMAATARLFVFPHRDQPAPVDAIVMFAGSPGRLERAVALARAGYAPVLAVSTPTADDPCPAAIPGVEVICFAPSPLTTQGESRWVGAAAARRGWHSLIVITSTSQSTRARLRLGRCYPGEVRMIGVPPPRRMWPYMITYEWAAMGKALLFQRSC